MNIFSNKKILSFLLIFSVLFPIGLYAQVSLKTSPFFGGKINKVTYCTCYYDPAVILEIKDYASNETVKVKYSLWTSKLRENYNIWESNIYVIGGYSDTVKESCKDTIKLYCRTNSSASDQYGVIDYVRGIGSSLTPDSTGGM